MYLCTFYLNIGLLRSTCFLFLFALSCLYLYIYVNVLCLPPAQKKIPCICEHTWLIEKAYSDCDRLAKTEL